MFDVDQVRATTFVRHVEIYDTLGSTNERAVELASRSAIELPGLVVARRQTAGKGRGRNTWWSAEGGLTFSLLIDATTSGLVPAAWPQLSLATAVALCDVLRRNVPLARIGIKWPNDVLIDGRKVSGILIESPGGAAPAKDRLIIGIGVNVNNSWASAPASVGTGGTSLCDATHRQHDLPSLLVDLLQALAGRIRQLRVRDAELFCAWQELDLLAGKAVVVEIDERRIAGECVEIAVDGALVVDSPLGRQRIYSGSVRIA
jgi:BirA family biotin operon repressor/biotin-[acetyl-CoA-carboxylase] ligase